MCERRFDFKTVCYKTGLAIQYVQADCFFPLAFDDSGQIQQCVFTEQFRKGQKIYTRLEVHTLQENRSESQTGPLLQPMTTALEARSA